MSGSTPIVTRLSLIRLVGREPLLGHEVSPRNGAAAERVAGLLRSFGTTLPKGADLFLDRIPSE